MKVIATELREVLLLEPKVHEDARGLTYESYDQRVFKEATGVDIKFVQENRSRSAGTRCQITACGSKTNIQSGRCWLTRMQNSVSSQPNGRRCAEDRPM